MNAKVRLDLEVLRSGFPYKEWYWKIYLKSDHWNDLRLRKLEQCRYKCSLCDKKKKLDVHHMRYKNIYDIELIDLLACCRKCHKAIHETEAKRKAKNRIRRWKSGGNRSRFKMYNTRYSKKNYKNK